MSVRAELQVAVLRLVGEKRTWTDPRKLHKEIRRSQRPSNAEPPGWLLRRFQVHRFDVDGFPCYTVRGRPDPSGPHVLHLHGGAYVQQISGHHWRFVRRLVERLDATVTVPLYPLAPAHHATDTLPMVRAAYDRALLGDDPARRVLMGDSAGAGLSLALAQAFRDEGHPQPARIVLISPWLDVTMTDPSVPDFDRRDPYLGASGLAEAGRCYAGPLDVRDPRVSPLFGELTGLAPIAILIGTRDVLLTDARRLRDKATSAGVPTAYREHPGMIHNWPMRRLPEARAAFDELAVFIGPRPRPAE